MHEGQALGHPNSYGNIKSMASTSNSLSELNPVLSHEKSTDRLKLFNSCSFLTSYEVATEVTKRLLEGKAEEKG